MQDVEGVFGGEDAAHAGFLRGEQELQVDVFGGCAGEEGDDGVGAGDGFDEGGVVVVVDGDDFCAGDGGRWVGGVGAGEDGDGEGWVAEEDGDKVVGYEAG